MITSTYDPFFQMTSSIRSLRDVLEDLGHEPRIMELKRDGESYVLDIERMGTGAHSIISSDLINGYFSFLVHSARDARKFDRIWFVDDRWVVGVSMLGKGVL